MKLNKFKKILINIIKKYPIMIYFIFSNFINSILVVLLTIGTLKFRSIIFNLGFCILLSSFSLLFKDHKKRNIYYICMSIFMIAICIINSIYYGYYLSYASASLLATSVFLKDVSDTLKLAINLSDWIYLWSLIGLLIIMKLRKEEIEKTKKRFHQSIITCIAIICLGSTLPPYYSYSRFIKLWNRISVVETFGIYVYQMDDLVQSLKPAFNNMFGYDKALKETKDYYEAKEKQIKSNEYTGIFEGKNVIAIHAESLQTFNLGLSFEGKEVTPNLNKLASSGIYFNNFYAQVGVGTSSDSEFTYASSLLPANNGTVFVNYYNNKFITIQNLLKNKNYYVFSMHGNIGDFWNRDAMHLNMGYDKFYSKNSFIIDEEYGLGLSDKSFFSQVVPKIKEIKEELKKPYYGTLITLSNHTPWANPDEITDYKVTKTIDLDGELVTRNYLEGTTLGSYIKLVHYMDEAIGMFLKEMDKNGLLDNTVIVIYGDHDARINKKQYEYMYNYNPITDSENTYNDIDYYEYNDYEYELNRKVPFIIWTKDMSEGITIDTPMGMIDVLPTLGNMLNINNKYALGKDIMSINKDDGIVVFKDGSFITNKIYYSIKNNEYYTLGNYIIDDNYIKNKSEYANKIIEISNNIINYNLLKDLE